MKYVHKITICMICYNIWNKAFHAFAITLREIF